MVKASFHLKDLKKMKGSKKSDSQEITQKQDVYTHMNASKNFSIL